MKMIDHTGKRFERLTVLRQDGLTVTGHKQWLCKCDCGNEVSYRGTLLTQGVAKSCGCLRADNGAKAFSKHGMYYHSAYSTWPKMMHRCHNVESDDYPDYGGRGITVCERWHDVVNFIEDMGERPAGMSIDRIDVDKGYEPGNCKWSTAKEQANNKRNTLYVEYEGKRCTISDIETLTGIAYKRLYHLIKMKNMTGDEAVKLLASNSS